MFWFQQYSKTEAQKHFIQQQNDNKNSRIYQ